MPFGRRNPFEEVEELLERMGRELDAEGWPAPSAVDVDVVDHGDRYVVTADLPGYQKESIDVRLLAGSLQLDAERDLDPEERDIDYRLQERRREPVSRRIPIPDPVAEQEITATYVNGVLSVELPKQDADAGTSIDID